MKPVTLYTKSWCGYSRRAKELLSEKGVPYRDIDVTEDEAKESEMVERAGGATTVPQIFIGDQHIGGYSELFRLDRRGELDRLLADEGQPEASP